jgi:putative DNA primase/helicase
LDWQKNGLQPTQKVQAATSKYREEMDIFEPFLAECCVIHKQAEVWASELWAAYRTWCADNGVKEQSQTRFGRYLTNKGFFPEKNPGGKIKRVGIGLRLEQDLG